jgi:mRNA interferase RelE/StbE
VTYRIEVAPAAARQLRKLDPPARRRIQAAVELLAQEPRPAGAKKLVGGDREWRVRTGDYRIVYEIHDQVLLVLVLAVGHRRDIYQGLP